MSKAKEAIEPESATKLTEGRAEPNGSIVPIARLTDDLDSQLEVATDPGMEVDDEYLQSADEPEIQWRRQLDDSRSTYPSVPLQHRSLRPFDSVSV
jgi:hypothetical protein